MIICRTPFRVSFFGGGTDYATWFSENGGAFLSTTINKYCYIMARKLPPFFEVSGRISWSKIENVNQLDEIENPVVRECLRFLKMQPTLDIHYHGDLPARSGLGSSSAFAVGLLNALHALNSEYVTKRVLAAEAIRVEQELIGDVVGVQDQTAVAYGGLNHAVIDRQGEVSVRPVIMPPYELEEFQSHILLFFTGISRNATNIAAEKVKSFTERQREMGRIRELVDEGLNILQCRRDYHEFGRLLDEAWQMKRSLASAISNDLIDNAYAAARRAGAIGGKILGAGGGGFLLVFAPPECHSQVIGALDKLLHVPIEFEKEGSQIIFYDPDSYSRTESRPRLNGRSKKQLETVPISLMSA
jgi:D-glycero-alpha-D-manno-heptose-7-phosphate kinase